VPPELALALWTMGAASAWEADWLLREAARKNSSLLDALKGPLDYGDARELGYEAEGLSGLEDALETASGGPGTPVACGSPAPGAPSGAGTASDAEEGSGAGTASGAERASRPEAASGCGPSAAGQPSGAADRSAFLSSEGGDPPAFRPPAPSPANAALLRDLWLKAARPLLRAGDRLAASGNGFEGLMGGLFAPDPHHSGDYIYADV
jgi:hypothetical protein